MNELFRSIPSQQEIELPVEKFFVMPSVERTLRPPFPIETVVFDNLGYFNNQFDPDYVYESAKQTGGTYLTPQEIAEQLMETFVSQSHLYDVPYERWMRTRYANGIQTPFTGFEPDALASNQTSKEFVQEAGTSYLRELKRMHSRFQRDVFETLTTEKLHVGALVWLNERYAAQRAICRARSRRCAPLQEYRSELDRSISSVLQYREKEDQKGNKIINPSSYTINLPSISTNIGHVFASPVEMVDVEKPAGFASRVGIIGNPSLRALLKYIPPIDLHRIQNQIYHCQNY